VGEPCNRFLRVTTWECSLKACDFHEGGAVDVQLGREFDFATQHVDNIGGSLAGVKEADVYLLYICW